MRRFNPKLMKSFHDLQRCRATALAFFSAILVTCLLILNRSREFSTSQVDLKRKGFNTAVQLNPSMGFMNGTDLIWQFPDSPKAALLIAHGCNGRAANFWDKSSGCPMCVGLPEERLLVLHALERKFAVLTISSVGKCWTFGKEIETVKWIIMHWITTNKLEKLPLVALGASSGGHFVSALATEMRFSSIVLMIAEGLFDPSVMLKDYPPTLFLHMPKDTRRMRMIAANMETLRRMGVDVKEVRCFEFPLTPNYFSDRIPGLNLACSVQFFEMLRDRGFVDALGYMRKDGRATQWKKALKEKHCFSEKHQLKDHIQEELNLAFAYHEMTSLQSDDIFGWFDSHIIVDQKPHMLFC